MTEPTKEQAVEKEGIEVDGVTFDANGKAQGLSEAELNDVAGGVMADELAEGTNNRCINAYSC